MNSMGKQLGKRTGEKDNFPQIYTWPCENQTEPGTQAPFSIPFSQEAYGLARVVKNVTGEQI